MKRVTAILLLVGSGLLIALLGSIIGVGIYQNFFEQKRIYIQQTTGKPIFSKYTSNTERVGMVPDFVPSAEVALPAVVHISSIYEAKSNQNDLFFPFREFFGDESFEIPEGQASGSGVIISPDGYIVTNNHVIEDADQIEVTFYDNRSLRARVIGTDLTTDLALLKVEGTGYNFLTFGNSDEVKVGEWVLAVGNPMNLTSTVTAGIVSAKGRNINLLREDSRFAIESFIQTDAAVNPGNSGGALVNQEGELVGINTAIASRTGSFAGYSFAIPSAIVKKVTEDLLTYGSVQRGFLGVTVEDVTAELSDRENLKVLQGAYVTEVGDGSGAEDAGMKAGDVIIAVNGVEVTSTPALLEQVGRYRPGDVLEIQCLRDGQEKKLKVTLKNLDGEAKVANYENKGKRKAEMLGSSFHVITSKEKETLGVEYGVVVDMVGEKLARGGIQKGFVVTEVNGRKVSSIEELEAALEDSGSSVSIKGMYDKDKIASYSFSWR